VTAGVLVAEGDADDVAGRLRGFVNATVSGLTGAVQRLDSLGISSNGNDNNLALTDSAKLDSFLASNLNDVQKLFSDSTEGLGVKLSDFLKRTVGDDGSLTTRQTTLGKQISDIDNQVSDMERIILANRQRMIDSFVAMESAQANINQQLAYLSKRFG
jgi:flagellar hook-associated protein 2